MKYDKCFVPIPGFPGYEINLNGEVWSHRSGRLLTGYLSKKGYCTVTTMRPDGNRGEWTGGRHRLLAIAFLGLDITSKLQIDHRDEDKGNDDISNLRIASNAENRRNISMMRSNTSGHRGVSWDKRARKWQVQIRSGSKQLHLGIFDDINEAAAARKAAEIKYYGKFRPGYSADQPTDGGAK
tara:strand:+ start:3115 stop:3660 length:546 start_codon:yes stop_codon:yes gene_type:complete